MANETVTTLTPAQAEAIFASIKGTQFVGITAITTPVLEGGKKGNSMFGRIRKHTKSVIFCGKKPSYSDLVKHKGEKAFAALEMLEDLTKFEIVIKPQEIGKMWGGKAERLAGATLRHTDTDVRYIQTYYLDDAYVEVSYTLDGVPIAKEDIDRLKPSRPTVKKVVATLPDGVEVTVKIHVTPRVYKLASIMAFRHNKVAYEINHSEDDGQTVEQVEEAPVPVTTT